MDGAISTIGYPDLFAHTIFNGDVRIRDLHFTGDANFVGSEFFGQRTQIALAAPNCADLSDCIFHGDVHLENIRGKSIKLDRAQFQGTATLAMQAEMGISLERARFHKEMSGFIVVSARSRTRCPEGG
jgi:hypothetical protein